MNVGGTVIVLLIGCASGTQGDFTMFAQKEYWDDVPPLGRQGRRWLRRKLYRLCQIWLRANTQIDPEDEYAGPLIPRGTTLYAFTTNVASL
jgi:hypothetical protein